MNKVTGQATKVGDFPRQQEFVALAIAPEDVADDAPARAGEVRTDFREGSLKGKLIVTAPSLTFGGAPLSGDLSALRDVEKSRLSKDS